MAREKKAIEGRAGRPRQKTNDLRLVSEMNEQTGEFNTVSTAPGDRRRALSFDSRTVLGTFFENLRNQYGRPSDLG